MMEYPQRKQNRIPEYDYSCCGAYFVTLCVENRRCILSKICVGDGVLDVPQVKLSRAGMVVKEQIEEINRVYDHVSIEHYVVMPNHVHMLVIIHRNDGTSRTPSPTNSVLASLMSRFKRFVHRKLEEKIFQRSYHDHVIRGHEDYAEIWQYIDTNPARWTEDRFYI